MTRKRTASLLGALALTLAAGALAVWGRPPSGPIIGTLDLGAQISTLTLAPAEGRAFAWSAADSRVFVLDVRAATLARVLTVPSPIGTGPLPALIARIAPGTADGQLFLTDALSKHVYAIPESGGPSRVVAALPPGTLSAPYLAVDAAAHRLFVLADGPPEGRLSVYDTRTLRPLWSTPLRSGNAPASGGEVSDAAAPLVVDAPAGVVIAGHLEASVVSVVIAANGRSVATLHLGPSSTEAIADVPSVAVDDHAHHAYASLPNAGTVATLDVLHGRVVRTLKIGDTPAAPLVDERTGRVIVASLGAVSVLDARSGALVRTTISSQTIDRYPVAIDERSGNVYAAGFNGQSVGVFDGSSGRLRSSTPVPGDPEAIAADNATGRVFVVVGHRRNSTQGMVAGATALCVLDGATGHLRHVVPLAVSIDARLYLDGRTHRALLLLDGVPRPPRPDPWKWAPAWLRTRLPVVPGALPTGQFGATSVLVVDTTDL